MLFAQPGRTHGLGGATTSGKTGTAVDSKIASIQRSLKAIQEKTKDNGFDPGKTDGSFPGDTAKAIFYALAKIQNAPGISDVLSEIRNVPGVGDIIGFLLDVGASRTAIDVAWRGALQSQNDAVRSFIRDHAEGMAKGFALAATAFGEPFDPLKAARATRTTTTTALAPTTIPTGLPKVSDYPPGSVAVRDPAAGMLRIIAPPK